MPAPVVAGRRSDRSCHGVGCQTSIKEWAESSGVGRGASWMIRPLPWPSRPGSRRRASHLFGQGAHGRHSTQVRLRTCRRAADGRRSPPSSLSIGRRPSSSPTESQSSPCPSDNGNPYRARPFPRACSDLGISPRRTTVPHRPRVERQGRAIDPHLGRQVGPSRRVHRESGPDRRMFRHLEFCNERRSHLTTRRSAGLPSTTPLGGTGRQGRDRAHPTRDLAGRGRRSPMGGTGARRTRLNVRVSSRRCCQLR
jgi:hypothetical protein